jgi:hypothetical protein
MIKPFFLKHAKQSAKGSATLLAVAMTMLSLVLVIGNAVGSLSNAESSRLISGENQQQLYYVTQAGIQEALGSRFYPRSNWLAMQTANPVVAGTVTPDRDPFYRLSGRVVSTNLAGQSQVMGMYRYLVLGGDPARNPNNGQYLQTPSDYVKLVSHEDRIDQNFYVISRGVVCLNSAKEVVPNDIKIVSGVISCSVGTLRHQTILSEFEVSQEDVANPQTTIPNRLVRSTNLEGALGTITLPAPVQLANGTVSNTLEFNTEWNQSASFAHLEKVMVYPTMNPKLNTNWRSLIDISSAYTKGPADIQPNEALRLYFRGPVHHKSVYDYEPEKCNGWDAGEPSPGTDRSWQCHVRIEQLDRNGNPVTDPATGRPKVYKKAALVPIFPSATQLIVYPPSDVGEGMSPSSRYRLVVDKDLQDTFGRKTGTDYVFDFCVGGCPT